MSGIKPQELTEFYWLLRDRGVTTDSLAAELDVSGSLIRKLIGGFKPRRGPVWRALLSRLEPRERELLLRVEQSPTWNMHTAKRRIVFTPEKAAEIVAAREQREAVAIG